MAKRDIKEFKIGDKIEMRIRKGKPAFERAVQEGYLPLGGTITDIQHPPMRWPDDYRTIYFIDGVECINELSTRDWMYQQ